MGDWLQNAADNKGLGKQKILFGKRLVKNMSS